MNVCSLSDLEASWRSLNSKFHEAQTVEFNRHSPAFIYHPMKVRQGHKGK